MEGIIIRAKDLQSYCDEYFFSAMEKWALTKMWGLPNGCGWANEPSEFIDAITALESEQNKMEKEQMDKMKEK